MSEAWRGPFPFVSVIMPVRNEARFIEAALAGALAQDYPADRLEVIVADGSSTDGTRETIQRVREAHASLRFVENPGKIVSSGLNRALAEARGDIIVRLDAHGEYPKDYVRQIVALREETGAANAGGVLVPTGASYVQRSICAAFSSPVGIGSAALRSRPDSGEVREVDTVNGGCWRSETLRTIGGFSEEMVRNQDDELSFRIRKTGGRIVQASWIRFRYAVRDRWSRLFLQFAQYGYWKVRLVSKYPRQASIRHLVPALLVVTLLAGAMLGRMSRPAALAALGLGASYLMIVVVAALVATWSAQKRLWPGVILAFLMMHLGYGCGFLMGLLALAGRPAAVEAWFSRLTR